jgi:hypothetical protein
VESRPDESILWFTRAPESLCIRLAWAYHPPDPFPANERVAAIRPTPTAQMAASSSLEGAYSRLVEDDDTSSAVRG